MYGVVSMDMEDWNAVEVEVECIVLFTMLINLVPYCYVLHFVLLRGSSSPLGRGDEREDDSKRVGGMIRGGLRLSQRMPQGWDAQGQLIRGLSMRGFPIFDGLGRQVCMGSRARGSTPPAHL